MLDLAKRISAFEILGRFIGQHSEESKDEDLKKLNQYFLDEYRQTIQQAGVFNNWFTPQNVQHALQQWSDALKKDNLEAWVNHYSKDHFETDSGKNVAIIMAGNLPLVGFHDFLSVLLSGHQVLIKPSSDDNRLLPFLSQILVAINKGFAYCIKFADGKLENFDAVIATGSDNSARYFDHYFSKYPHIIRKNRTSIAVINGGESKDELENLGEDIFRYFGLGCRNVSKIYLPKDYKLDSLFEAFFKYKEVIDNKKYGNNYDYNRAIFLMEKQDFFDNGFVIMKESDRLHAPGAVVFYEFYENEETVLKQITNMKQELQCVVGKLNGYEETLAFGDTQKPALWDYADHVDVIKFLRSI
jgi:hypothetical protein